MINVTKIIKKLPDSPGVYFFKGSGGTILYVGKATSLRDRVRSYFAADIAVRRGPLITKMLESFKKVDFIATDSVLEALILEAALIKKYQPPNNSKEKDNKSFNYVVLTDDEFPKVLLMRGRTLHATSSTGFRYIFGPFPHGAQLKEAMKIIRRIFPFTDNKCVPADEQFAKGRLPRPCFNRQIGLCPGVCVGAVTKKEYGETVKNLKLFFEGKKKAVIRNLTKQMNEYAALKEFEKATNVRKTIFSLNHIHDIALLKHDRRLGESMGGQVGRGIYGESFRIEAYDVAHLQGGNVVGVMTVVEDSEVARDQYRKFKILGRPNVSTSLGHRVREDLSTRSSLVEIKKPGIDDTAALREILERRFNHPEWATPRLIVVDGGKAQINAAEAVLKERNLSISVVSVVKDERHKPREILGNKAAIVGHEWNILLANSEAHRFALSYHRNLRSKNF